jgi:hypothetical protein
VCKWTDSPTMDCPDVCLEEFYRSECSETVQVGCVRVFEEFLTVFNCSVLTFWSAIKFHRE